MSNTEKKINKWLIWAIIWWAIVGASALSATKKWQSFWQKVFSRAKWYIDTAIQQGERVVKWKKDIE